MNSAKDAGFQCGDIEIGLSYADGFITTNPDAITNLIKSPVDSGTESSMFTTMTIEPLGAYTMTTASSFSKAIEGTDVEEYEFEVVCTLVDYPAITDTYNFQINVRAELSRRELQDDEMNCENDFIQLEDPFVAD